MPAENLSKLDTAALVSQGIEHCSSDAEAELKRRGEEAVPHLVRALGNKGLRNRWWAAMVLGQIESKASVAPLIAALDDAEADVARWSAEALGHIGDAPAVEPLLRTLRHADKDVREYAATSLGMLKDRRAVEPLARLVLEDDSWYVRCKAADALGALKDPAAVPALLKTFDFAGEGWDHVIRDAAKALQEIGTPIPLEGLVAVLSREFDDWGRSTIVSSLAALARHDMGALLKGLESPDAKVRAGCAEALASAGGAGSVEPLLRLLNDAAKPVRDAARDALKAQRKRGIPVALPSRDPAEAAADGLRWLMENYFVSPSTEGFSPYRTGSFVHVLFSVCVVMAAALVFKVALSMPPILEACGAAAAAVFLLWGAGVWLGIMSHYNPLITLGVLAATGVLSFVWSRLTGGGVKFLFISGLACHFAAAIAVLLLGWLWSLTPLARKPE